MYGHVNTAQKGKGQDIHAAIRKYGWSNFSREELYYSTDKQHALDMEDVFINLYETKGEKGYNVTRGGQPGPPKGKYHHSEETKKKMSGSMRGKKHVVTFRPPTSEETCKKISESNIGKPAWNKGKCGISEETRQKMREAKLGTTRPPRTEEWRRKLSESNKGKYFGKRGVGCRKG
jgi:group I intron endonuclease